MKTIITLEKKQGLFRPRATVTVELEPWERELLPTNVSFTFTAEVEVLHYDTEGALWSIENRDMQAPYSRNPYVKYDKKSNTWRWTAFLPWKPGKLSIDNYPELEKLAQHIRDRAVKILTAALESVEIKDTKELLPPREYKQKAAAYKFAALAKEDKPCGNAND
jgi:hypothetical protein